jgi:hypothetical protein
LIDDKSIIIAIFIDFTKAFDLVKQKLLSRKLFHYGFSNNALKLLENYFESRSQITKINNTLSNAMPIELGVPQGSILGPLLFLIFINDMSLSTDFHTILFADDTTLYDSDSDLSVLKRKFNRKFQVIHEWITLNQMSLNWSKTKIMFLTKKRVEIPEANDTVLFFPGNLKKFGFLYQSIDVVSEFKLLGIMLDNSLSFTGYLKQLKKNVTSKLFSIHRIFFLSFSIRIQFFKTFLLPHFDYCNSLLIYFSDSIVNQIESLFNFCIFKLLKIDLKSLTLQDQLKRLSIYNIFPYKYRAFFRLCIFFRKIMSNVILSQFFESLEPIKYKLRNNDNLYMVPKSRTLAGSHRISIFLPECINVIIRNSYMISLSDFKTFVIFNITNFYEMFLGIRQKLKRLYGSSKNEDESIHD